MVYAHLMATQDLDVRPGHSALIRAIASGYSQPTKSPPSILDATIPIWDLARRLVPTAHNDSRGKDGVGCGERPEAFHEKRGNALHSGYTRASQGYVSPETMLSIPGLEFVEQLKCFPAKTVLN